MRYRIYPGYGLAPLFGRMEPDVQQQLARRLRPGATAVDVGANYGIHTLLMARLVGESGAVVAFEPSPTLFRELEANLQRNDLLNVTALQLAITDSTGDAEFLLTDNTATGRLRSVESTPEEDRVSTINVRATSLDLLVSKGELPLPDLIKIDVEGAESRVLDGSTQILRAVAPDLIIELHNPEQDVAVGSILSRLGYEIFRLPDLIPVSDPSKGWPDPHGIWGHVVAVKGGL
jgi:FkbM family methyltransferase